MKRKFLFKSDSCQLASVRHAVRDFLHACGLAESETEVLVLAIDEACTNVIRYAYDHKCRPVRLLMEHSADHICITLRDYGKSCEPEKIKSRALEDIRPGGVGVHIIREVFDEVTYTPKSRGTELRLVKKLSGIAGPHGTGRPPEL